MGGLPLVRGRWQAIGRPSFDEVYQRLLAYGPARVVSSRDAAYDVSAEFRGIQVIIARLVGKKGEIRVHADCWGDAETCQRTRAGGIYNGDPSIYGWYLRAARS